jgi:hypothetical protein
MTSASLPPHDPRRRPARPDGRGSILAEALLLAKTRLAIKALREKTGLGFEQARDAVEGHARPFDGGSEGLSPGEVPRRAGLGRAVLVVLLLIGLGYLWLRFRGQG